MSAFPLISPRPLADSQGAYWLPRWKDSQAHPPSGLFSLALRSTGLFRGESLSSGSQSKKSWRGRFFYASLSRLTVLQGHSIQPPRVSFSGLGHQSQRRAASCWDVPAPLSVQRDSVNQAEGDGRLPRVWRVQSNPAPQPQKEELSGRTDPSANPGGCFISLQLEGHRCQTLCFQQIFDTTDSVGLSTFLGSQV